MDETPSLSATMGEAMMAMTEGFAPLFEAARGLKASLEADGWSPTAAEDVAREFMVSTIRKALTG